MTCDERLKALTHLDQHADPDYSAAYVVVHTDRPDGLAGHGLAFTLGRGTEIIVAAVRSLSRLVVGRDLSTVYDNFAAFWRELTSESQLRWVSWSIRATRRENVWGKE